VTLAVLLSPRRFADWALRTGTFPQALVFIGLAMAFSIVGAYRLATTIRVEDLVFGPTRSSFVDTLIAAIGVDRTTVLVYMLERSFDVLVVASAITPLFLWLLGSSAMHAAARIRGIRGHAYLPMIVLFAYAEVGYQVPTSTAGILFGSIGAGPGPQLASAVSVVALAWFALVVYRGIEIYYGVSGERAIAIFLLGAIVFYIVPLILIVGALIAIVLAASLLEYF